MICKCGKTVHPVRIELGYNTCVSCSSTKKVSYIPIIANKQVLEVQIVSQELSAAVHKSWRRKQLEGAAVSGRLHISSSEYKSGYTPVNDVRLTYCFMGVKWLDIGNYF